MTKLKGKPASSIEKRLKALFYGEAGSGKTTASIQFPKPYLIDTEKGASYDQYVKLLNDHGGVIFHTTSFDDLIEEIKTLLTEKHEYKTLIIDPLTTLYNDLLEKSARERISDRDPDGTAFGGHYSKANSAMKKLFNLLLRLDMNVIITCHAKNEYGANLAVLGQTFDCYKKLDYLFDLVLQLQKRGKQKVALVKKSRIETFEDSETFSFSYNEIAKRYGREILERDSEAQELATPTQLADLIHLIEQFKIPIDTVQKWLDKASATELTDLPKDSAQKIIDHLTKQIKRETNEDK